MKKVTMKEVLTSGKWIITKVMNGYKGRIRIDAKRRNWEADGENFFSEWASEKYIKSLNLEVLCLN